MNAADSSAGTQQYSCNHCSSSMHSARCCDSQKARSEESEQSAEFRVQSAELSEANAECGVVAGALKQLEFAWSLKFRIWSLFGIWSLVLGAFELCRPASSRRPI